MGPKKIPYIITNDGRTLRFPNPDIKRHDSIKLNLDTNEIVEFYKYKIGANVMITGGNNIGRIGTIVEIEKHPGSYEIVYVKDTLGKEFSTRLGNIFVIGDKKPEVTLLKNHTRYSIIEERERNTKKKVDEEE
jgi:small subunit ribosomal protein S4e